MPDDNFEKDRGRDGRDVTGIAGAPMCIAGVASRGSSGIVGTAVSRFESVALAPTVTSVCVAEFTELLRGRVN